jgi:hypothetical protein
MPIHKMTLEGDVFVARAVGYLDNMDAKLWANALQNHAGNSLLPIAAVMDMVEVNRLCPTVTKIFSEISRNPNMRAVAIVISDSMASQNARVIDKLGEIPGVRVFPTHEEANRFARSRLTAPAVVGSGWGAATVSSFAFAF